MLLALVMPALGLAAPAEPQAAAATAPDARPAIFPGTESLSSTLGENPETSDGAPSLDRYQWLDPAAKNGLLVSRLAFGPEPVGVILILTADLGAKGDNSFAGQLRSSLPGADWHTYLLSVPVPPRANNPKALEAWHNDVAARVQGALTLVAEAHSNLPRVVLGEGRVGVPLAAIPDMATNGLVLLNLPTPQGLAGLAQAARPTLVLQVLPSRLPKGYQLAATVTTRQLPRMSPRQPKSLLLRQVRGWLRQYEADPNTPTPQTDAASVGAKPAPPLPS